MLKTWTCLTLAVALVAAGAGTLFAGIFALPDGNPEVDGFYAGNFKFKNAPQTPERKKSNSKATLDGPVFQDGPFINANLEVRFPGEFEPLLVSLTGEIGNGNFFLESNEGPCRIYLVGTTKGKTLAKRKLKGVGVMFDEEPATVATVKLTAKRTGAGDDVILFKR